MSRSFRDLIAFQRALDLTAEVYSVTADFPRAELYGLVSQLRRASVGVMSQIAEGQGRLSFGEWRQFLSQARGSLYEVEAEALGANRLHFVSDERLNVLENHINRTGRALNGLIEWVKKKERECGALRTRPRRVTSKPRDLVTS